MQRYEFSVIIPTCGRSSLFKCLEKVHLAISEIKPVKCQIIVSDDNASERTRIEIKNLNSDIEYRVGPQKGPAANRNNGAIFAKGDWLIFTDDDCLPDSGWLQEILKVIKNYDEKMIAFEGSILPLGNIDNDMADCPVNINGACFWSANIGVKKVIFEKITGFDENFSIAAFEDIDIFLRIQKLGKVEFIKKAIVYHPVRIERLGSYLKKVPLRMKSWVYLRNKHGKFENSSFQEIMRMFVENTIILKRNLSWKKRKRFSLTLIRIIINPWMFLYFQRKIEKGN